MSDLRNHCSAPLPSFTPFSFRLFGQFARHVVFIMLGQNGIGHEAAILLQLALGHDTLPFTERSGRMPL